MNQGLLIRATSGVDKGLNVAVETSLVIGRGGDGDVVLADRTVSRRHCRIEPAETTVDPANPSKGRTESAPRLTITDLDSTGGTSVNGTRVTRSNVGPGDEFTIGSTTFCVLALIRFSDAAACDALAVTADGRDRHLSIHGPLTIGRDPLSDITTDDPTVSRSHAVIRPSGNGVEIEDLGSSNFTFINGARLDGRTRLNDGDVVAFGRAAMSLRFRRGPRAESLRVRVSIEGQEQRVQMAVSSPADATVAQVTAALAGQLADPPINTVLYRTRDGIMLHPDDLWLATGTLTGDHLVIGEGDATELRAADTRQWPTQSTHLLNQLPRTVYLLPEHQVDAVEVPETTSLRGRGMVWQIAGGLGAVLIGLTLAIVNPSYAIFGLITGGIGIISILASILGDQSRRKYKVKEYRDRIKSLNTELAEVRESQRTNLYELYPDLEEITARIERGSSRIWERRPADGDALELRVGIGDRPAAIDFDEPRGHNPELVSLYTSVQADNRMISEAPITVPARQVGSLGIAGSRGDVSGLINRMVLEAATQLPPDQLRIFVAGADPSWDWCRWLPHVPDGALSTAPGDANEVLLSAGDTLAESISANQHGGPNSELTLIIVPDSTVRADLNRLVSKAGGNALVVIGASDHRQLPGGLDAVLAIQNHENRPYGQVTGTYNGCPEGPLWIDLLDDNRAETLAIALARGATARRSEGPGGLVELLALGSAADVDVAESWRSVRTDPLTMAFGTDDSGDAVTVGIRRDGPHGMIAGTTGSGKSELLQSIITAAVLQNPPDRLNLFLIDFKGGSTFAPFAMLPHVVGLVTDIENDETLAERAFKSLDAEIDRRKRLLEAAKVSDITAYERLGAAAEPLANLVVVIDEFALLVQRLPDVRERLDTVATQGRSLGIHLLLATQSPSGAITHAIRTNTNLWICLRVVTESESTEVLGTRDAARLPDGSPGRGFIRLGAGDSLRSFHAARIGRPVIDDISSVHARRLDGQVMATSADGPVTELDLVVSRIIDTTTTLGVPPARSLWLEPLPGTVTDTDLAQVERLAGTPATDPTKRRLVTALGLTEDLDRQTREVYTVDLTDRGHLLVTGSLGSGRTTALQRTAVDLANRFDPSEVHIYGIDGGAGGLRRIEALANVGAVISSDDTERLGRLIDRLTHEIAIRRERLSAANAVSFVDVRSSEADLPWIVLVIDDYPVLRANAESIDHGRLLERLMGLVQSGPAVGIHTVFSVYQATDLKTRELNLFGERIVLHSLEAADYSLVGVPAPAAATTKVIPGRGVIRGGHALQIALPTTATATEATLGPEEQATGTVTTASQPNRVLWARPVRRLPSSIVASELATYGSLESGGPVAPEGAVRVGVGGPEVEPVAIELSSTEPILLVAGPSRSGRTTALVNIAVGLCGPTSNGPKRQVTILAQRSKDWEHVAAKVGTQTVSEPDRFADALEEILVDDSGPRLLIIDDADSLVGVPGVSDRLEQILRRAQRTDTVVVVSARTGDLPGMFDPWSRYLVSLRRVLLLKPTRDDALYFGQTLPEIPGPVGAGRGVLIEGVDCMVVQILNIEDQ